MKWSDTKCFLYAEGICDKPGTGCRYGVKDGKSTRVSCDEHWKQSLETPLMDEDEFSIQLNYEPHSRIPYEFIHGRVNQEEFDTNAKQ